MQRTPEGPAALPLRILVVLWLAGLSLRVTILALPPSLQRISAEFSLGGADLGILAATPPFFFALAAIPGTILMRRIGAVPCLLAGLLLTALGAAARGFSTGVRSLELTTAIMCLGVAVMQPTLPTLVRLWTPKRIGLASATYTCGLLCGEVLPALWPVAPTLPIVGAGWRSVLVVWSLPVLATALLTVLLQPRTLPPTVGGQRRIWPDWKRSSIWRVGLLLGAVNASYFGLNGFLPNWLADAGGAAAIGSTLLTLNLAQVPAAILLMLGLERVVFRWQSYVAAGLVLLVASIALVVAPPEYAMALAGVAGFALAWLLTLALALPPLLVTVAEVPSVSAAVFTVSYGLAFATDLGTGLLADTGPSRLVSVLPIAGAAILIVVIGSGIRRPGPERMDSERTGSSLTRTR